MPSSDAHQSKSQRLNENWSRGPASSQPLLTSLSSPPDPEDILLHIYDATRSFTLMSIPKIMKDDTVTTRLYKHVDIGMLRGVMREKNHWSDEDENPRNPSKLLFLLRSRHACCSY